MTPEGEQRIRDAANHLNEAMTLLIPLLNDDGTLPDGYADLLRDVMKEANAHSTRTIAGELEGRPTIDVAMKSGDGGELGMVMHSHAAPVVVRTRPSRMCRPNVPTLRMIFAMRDGYACRSCGRPLIIASVSCCVRSSCRGS